MAPGRLPRGSGGQCTFALFDGVADCVGDVIADRPIETEQMVPGGNAPYEMWSESGEFPTQITTAFTRVDEQQCKYRHREYGT